MSNWFSNFVPYKIPLIEDGIQYATPEHYYQANKSVNRPTKIRIAALKTPGAAKRLGREIKLRPDWDHRKVLVMTRAILWRLETDPEWLVMLINSDGRIVERNTWHDNIWGDCTCNAPECQPPGKNLLGSIMMRLRNTILQARRKPV